MARPKANPKIIQFPNAATIYGAEQDIIAEVIEIRPVDAAAWLKANRNNRPIRKRHVEFLAREILADNWQVNGQAIIIADDEQILDGQHRLSAIIETGKSIKSMVVYGITPDAFKTIDTGAIRTGADALTLHFHGVNTNCIKAISVAVQWCHKLERGVVRVNQRLSNTDIIEYVKANPSLISCAESINEWGRDQRPLSHGMGTALLELFARKHEEKAAAFMRRLFLGEQLQRTDVEYVLRAALLRDAERTARYSMAIRMRMVIKGWNWLRRGNTAATRQTINITPTEDNKVTIF